MRNIVYADESYAIIGTCFEVYREKGNGFVEPVYQECVEIEMKIQALEFVSQKSLALTYKNHILKQTYIPDLICFDKIIVELKAVRELTDEHRAQVINYLKATGFKLGILVNFGHSPRLQHERFVL